ncbi:NADP-dependent oxidoreductase [Phenylobacterium sp.]|uniref:NADP-dependent oxidoreductase n=1 Tax=Phenylobacterium sp. TaxID=1871053 RepID=UPI0025EAD73D|nr:NADP-dependent oxidoreductase [Phenylobacterium sp.]
MPSATNRPINRKVVLVEYVNGMVGPEHFRIEEEPAREPGEGEVLVKADSLSIDAFIRTSLNAVEGLHQQVPLGGAVVALGVGRVIESNAPGFAVGDAVSGPLLAQTYATMPAAMLQKIDDALPLSTYLGALGLTTGITAYAGIRYVGEVKAGDTVLVSAAAGAVGSIAAQVAKNLGAKVIGLAGGPEKVAFLTRTLGLDSGIDYKNEDVAARLKVLAPDGIDVFFDNVGGELLDIALDHIRERGRVVICGAISQYNDHDHVRGPSLYLRLAERYARMEGFTVMHFAERYGEAHAQLAQWLKAGTLKMPEQVEHGIDAFPAALRRLFEGGNTGKMLVKP